MSCPECGQQNREDHNFCQHCGASLSTSRSTVVIGSRRKALLISIVALGVVLSAVLYFLLTREEGVSGTYISQDPQQAVQVFIELKEDNTVFSGFFLRWKVEANKMVLMTETDSAEVHIEGDRIIGKTGVTGAVVSEIGKRDGAKSIKSSQGRLWSAYFDQRSGCLIEFKEDGIVKSGFLDKYERTGDILTFCFKSVINDRLQEEKVQCKIKGNTITLDKMVFVKYRR